MLVASLWLAVAVALPVLASLIVTAIAGALVATGYFWYGAARVTVGDGEFRAGRAHLALRFVGEVTSLDAEATRRTAGVDADARAFLVLRPYLKRSVLVRLCDPADPTPYWLVSTRRPDVLARTLSAARNDPATAG